MYSKLSEIIAQLLEIHATEKVQLSIYFHGHVNRIEVDVHIPKWTLDKLPDLNFSAYLDSARDLEKFEKEISGFIKLFNALNQ